MRFQVEHPAHARLSCADCRKWVVDITRAEIVTRGGEPQPRPPHTPTPCRKCPKGSPEREKQLTLSWRNHQTLELYYRAKAGGLTEAERADPLVQRHLAAIELVMSRWKTSQLERAVANMVTAQVPRPAAPPQRGRR